jgi:hypothetical protein
MKRRRQVTDELTMGKTHDSDLALQSFRLLCQNIGSTYATKLLDFVNRKDWLAIANSSIDPSAYATPEAFMDDYAVHAYIRKYRGIKTSVNLVQKAELDFEKVEFQCYETNKRIRSRGLSQGAEGVLLYAKRKIAEILCPFELDRVIEGVDWGKGATQSIKLRFATLDKKILEPRLRVTPSCLKYARAYLEYDLHWMRARLGPHVEGPTCPLPSEFETVDSGRFSTVEKTVKSRRTIDIQPTMNLFFQKGVGSYIRRRLFRFGIDLDDQSRNQQLAARAKLESLSTIDLANASDSVSRDLVRLLLPPEWYEFLDDTRTHYLTVSKKKLKLEKFSSMGNGFTFELESLIFFAICEGVRKLMDADSAIVSVYGDDIVVSSTIGEYLCSVLKEVGFEVNVDKTYLKGDFYESCGRHFFDSVEVTPVFQKEEIVDNPTCIRACNRILRLASTMGRGLYLDTRCQDSYNLLRKNIKLKRIPLGPLWLEGDGFLKDPYFKPKKVDKNGIFHLMEFRNVAVKKRLRDDSPLLATTLRNGVVVESPFNGLVAVRGSTRTLQSRRRVYLQDDEVPVWACRLQPAEKP